MLGDCRQDQIQIATGVNDGGLTRLIVPHQRAVLLKGRHRNGLVLKHGEVSMGFKALHLQVNANTVNSLMRIVRVLSLHKP